MRVERMTLKQLMQEKLRRIQEDTKKKIDNLSQAELFVRENLRTGLGDRDFEEKKLESIVQRALKLATKEQEEKAKIEKVLKMLHEAEVQNEDSTNNTDISTQNGQQSSF